MLTLLCWLSAIQLTLIKYARQFNILSQMITQVCPNNVISSATSQNEKHEMTVEEERRKKETTWVKMTYQSRRLCHGFSYGDIYYRAHRPQFQPTVRQTPPRWRHTCTCSHRPFLLFEHQDQRDQKLLKEDMCVS